MITLEKVGKNFELNKSILILNFFCLIKMWRHSGIGYQPHNQLNWFRLGYIFYTQRNWVMINIKIYCN